MWEAGLQQEKNQTKTSHSYQDHVTEDAIHHLLYNRAYTLKQAGNSILFTSLSCSTSVIESKLKSHPLHEFLRLKCSPENCYSAALWSSLEVCTYKLKGSLWIKALRLDTEVISWAKEHIKPSPTLTEMSIKGLVLILLIQLINQE